MKIALVHDYLTQAGGAERVIVALHRLYPDAPIFTTIADPALASDLLPGATIVTSWMQMLPGRRRHFRKYFWLYPAGVAALDLSGFDVILSNSSAYVKSVRAPSGACHICYCHTPMRFAWDFGGYAAREDWGPGTRRILEPMISLLKRWDLRTANRPTRYYGNSSAVAARITRCYQRPAGVLYPPVDVERFGVADAPGEHHLIVSRLVAYKRIDLAIDAFNLLGLPLVIIGDGPARAALQRRAGPSITFLGRRDDAVVADHYRRCRAVVCPGEEDFGITPVEANASGRPVVAFGAGGALDTVIDGITGVHFARQESAVLAEAVRRCSAMTWDPVVLRRHAERFSEQVFHARVAEIVRDALHEKDSGTQGVTSITIG
ncbi:MAG TPA: glycosyltransferase [Gemmatimonadales bacterium]|jgi:glycosyltransferase involved in cell wall biosynthesis